MKQKRLWIILLAIVLLLGCTGRGQRATVSEERLLGVWEVESEGKNPDYLEFCGDGKARFAQEPYGAPLNTYLPYTIDADTVSFISGAIEKAVYDAESDRLSITLRDGEVKAAKRTEGINPYFTCTGTEYGPYPILPPEERRAEAEALFAEYREAFELAAKEWPDFDRFYVFNGKAYGWDPEQNGNAAVDPATLPESVQALVALSEQTGIDFYRTGPEPVFTEDAAPFFEVNLPMAIDTTMYQDPGILYEVRLIYTENTADQIRYSEMEPLAENWYIEVYFYAY